MAAEVVQGRSVLHHLLAHAADVQLDVSDVAVHARGEDHPTLAALAGEFGPNRLHLITGPPPAGSLVLRTDRLYHGRRLRRALRRGRDPETAVLWRLDRPAALCSADEELKRRLTYQPLGRFWAFPLAERIASALESTSVRPNQVTLAAAGLMLSASAMVALGGPSLRLRAAVCSALSLALVLDTVDGRLARLQGTCSTFGRWLDQVLDEIADIALHTAIAWSCFTFTGRPTWLLVGLLYVAGKYLFVVQSLLGDALEAESRTTGPSAERTMASRSGFGKNLQAAARRILQLAGHADVRWHLWILLAVIGRLDLALMGYAGYFAFRALAGGLRKAVAYA
jgi:phosphatidylglycerophosphate synthase